MSSAMTPGHGYQLQPEELRAQISALDALGERTRGLVGSAGELARRQPMLGTAPPAMHLAMRLRAAADEPGLTGEIRAAHTELDGFHGALKNTLDSYLTAEDNIASTLRTVEGSTS